MLRLIAYARRKIDLPVGKQFYYQDKIHEVTECNHDRLSFRPVNSEDKHIIISFNLSDWDVRVKDDYNVNKKSDILNESITVLELTPSVNKALLSNNICYIYDLTRQTEKDLTQIEKIGKKGLLDIKEQLSVYDLILSDE